ncbi:hypothetical protein MUA27_00520 [Mammaliicoccus sciuri]|uniref:hypothetical protein n=1 Tax=Mammaliicoccus sciuri TaxID=1296 RepID=UPI000BBF2B97|nr:hypothetical protein [Mammaliicoccus sciuri]PCM41104.1 hypothetical protein CPU09_06890 [Mammaliicoccus sciuri]UXU78150.1 hypothetical protein MUA27_00520 [Mammaliicoccus sciuri]
MKNLLGVCLVLVLLLAACGKNVDGTYSNKDFSITANSETGEATLHMDALESSGLFGLGASAGNLDGKVNADEKVMTFKMEDGQDLQLNYKVKGNKLIIDSPVGYGNGDGEVELTKE